MDSKKCTKKCGFCDYEHRLASQVRRHELQSHGEKAIECTVGCGLRVSYNRLARHIRERHPDAHVLMDCRPGLLEASLCDIQARQLKAECEQIAMHETRKLEPIDESGRKDQQLREQSTVSSSDSSADPDKGPTVALPAVALALGQHQCPECGQRKADRMALKRHIARVHERRYKENNRREKRHPCDWEGCGKSFASQGKLADHRNSHTGDRPFNCEHCNREFSSRGEFGRHLRKYHATSLRQLNRQIEKLVDLEEMSCP